MSHPLQKAKEGSLAPIEEAEIASCRHVGHILERLWSKARLSLREVGLDVNKLKDA